ncbi:thioredoxin family protein [Rubinisphaera italica]|uniref:AhpC/TSA family protein n=1 Tax=Rubinisphaera italica TaxID=2527969 RepID=A0A5C5XFD1_9PLAN|nr:thioredoxin family protein [Rubinisphaera italica]TWT61063.1 AhpC/TSA family protein [Rubinisphaera italica]
MNRIVLGMFLLSSLISGSNLEAGKYNPDRSIGDHFAGFDALPATDDKSYSTKDFKDADVLVIAFTCNSCPYAEDYESRFEQFQKKYAKNNRVKFVAINCNLVKADSLEKMKEKAEEAGFTFPYLFDESQQTGRDLGALRTPECFVLNKARNIAYMGAFDDSTNASEVKQQYVVDAVEALLQGDQPEIRETPPIGCLIRYKRVR